MDATQGSWNAGVSSLGLLSSLRFLRASLASEGVPSPRRTTLRLDTEELEADVYEPGRPGPTVLFVHGLSPRGERDPRLMHAASALAAAGCRVVAPRFPEVVALRLSPATPRRIVAVTRALAERGPVGLFSVSFTGSLCLRAAAAPEVADRVSGVLVLGGAARPAAVLEHAVAEPGADPYVWRLGFSSWLPQVVPGSEPVAAALREAVLDDSWDRVPGNSPAACAALSPEHTALLRSLDDPSERRRLAHLALSGDALGDLSPLPSLGALRCPVALLHGATDAVVPANESRFLHARMQELGLRSRLLITGLLTHGDTALGPRQVLDVPALAGLFAWWFRALRRRAR